MPITALGAYEIAITAMSNGVMQEFTSKTFLYCPVLRISVLLLVIIVTAFTILRYKLSSGIWIMSPFLAGLAIYIFLPDWNICIRYIRLSVLVRMGSLTAVAAVISFFRRRSRCKALLAIIAIEPASIALMTIIEFGWDSFCYMWIDSIIDSLTWTIPIVLSLLVIIPKFTTYRLFTALTSFTILGNAVIGYYTYFKYYCLPEWAYMRYSIAVQCLYILTFTLLITLNRKVRNGLCIGLGIKQCSNIY